MNYFRSDPLTYAREVASQIGGTLYFAGSIEDLELPDPNNFRDGDVIVHFDKVYVKNGNWVELVDNRYNPNGLYTFEYETQYEVEEETDTTLWLALLED